MYTPKWESPEELNQPIDTSVYSNDVIVTNLNTTENGEPDDGDTLTESLSKAFNKIGKLEKKDYDVDSIVNGLTESFVDKDTYTQDLEGMMDLFVPKEDGKGLSTNDYTDEDKDKVTSLYNQVYGSTSNDITVVNLNPNTETDEPDDGDTLTEVLSVFMKRLGKVEMKEYDVDSIIEGLTESFVDNDTFNTTLDKYVEKEEGKVLSSNDYTDEDKEKVTSLYNQVYGSTSNDITVTNLNPNTENDEPDDGDTLTEVLSIIMKRIGEVELRDYDVDTIVDELSKDFITVDALSNYVKKEEGKGLSTNDFTDEFKEKVTDLYNQIYGSTSNDITVVNLNSTEEGEPDDGDTLTEVLSKLMHQLGLIRNDVEKVDTESLTSEEADKKYAAKEDLSNYVLAEDGKGLSSNDYTDAEKDKLSKLSNEAKDIIITNINSTIDGAIDDGDNLPEFASKVVRDLEKLNSEIKTIDGITTGNTEDLIELIENADNYVLKEDGKGLSSNDYNDEDKEKVETIPKIQTKLDNLTSNNVTLANFNTHTDGVVDDGQSLSEAISIMCRDIDALYAITTGVENNVSNAELEEKLKSYILASDTQGLSTNDFTDEYKHKLNVIIEDGIDSNEVYVVNINPNTEQDIIDNGDSLTQALSVIMKDIGLLQMADETLQGNINKINYITPEAVDAKLEDYVKKEAGKGLSANDFTDKYKDLLDNPPDVSTDNVIVNLGPVIDSTIEIASGDSVSEAITTLIDEVGKLKQGIGSGDSITEITNQYYFSKNEINTILSNYLEKEEGKDLSSNDFTDDYKEALDQYIEGSKKEVVLDSNHITIVNTTEVGEQDKIHNGDSLSEAISKLMFGIRILNFTLKDSYANKWEIDQEYVHKEEGKGLSTNDFTDELKNKLQNLINIEESTDGMMATDTNHITVVNTTEVGEQDKIHNGDTVSEALSKLMYADRLINFTLRDNYLTRGQIELEYVHKRDGYDLSQNDFTDDYKDKIDSLTGEGDNSYFYNKEYIDAHFVKIEEGKGLSTNDFTNEYKDIIETLDDNYLRLDGGDMKGNINMSTHNITFTGGRIEFLRDGEVYSYLDSENFTGVADEAKHVGNLESIQRSTEYAAGDVVFSSGLESGKYLYCTKSGITAVLEPVWATSSKQRTIDGTSEWQTRILGMAYNEQGEEIGGQYLQLAGGTMQGSIDMADNDLLIQDSNSIVFYNRESTTGTVSSTQYSGNAATASALSPGFSVNGIHTDGKTDITLDFIPQSEKGVANGVASLDSTGRVPAEQLPSFVRSIVNVDTYDDLPNPGDQEIIYVTLDDNRIYRFTGISYVEVSSSSSISDSTVSLAVARLIRLIGDVTGEVRFDGSKDVAIDTSLADTDVIAGAYNTDETIHQITVLADGRINKMGPELVIAPKFANLKDKPNTLAGFGIIDGATKNHKHVVADITNFPDSMKANGGNADTVGGHYPGTNPGNVLVLDGEGHIPSSSIPAGAVFTRGMVIAWYGESNAVPTGWHICDGTNGTPDLRNRFIVGAGSSYAKGATGGEAQHTLIGTETPLHNHNGSIPTSKVSGTNHYHYFGWNSRDNSGRFGYKDPGTYPAFPSGSQLIAWNGSGHDNGLKPIGSQIMNMTTSIGINETASGTVDFSTGNYGGNQPHNNMPPYVALFYIMKL